MKQRVAVFFILLLLCLSAASVAALNESAPLTKASGTSVTDDEVSKSYQCLEKQARKGSLSLQEAIFTSLALGSTKNATDVLDREKSAQEDCWPRAGCKVKETAQVGLAYQKMGRNTEGIKRWLLSKTGTTSDLAWYIETDIENHQPSSCTIRYDGREYRMDIKEAMQLSGTTGPCLDISSSGYLLKIRDSCLERTFEISCNQSFVSTLVYQKSRSTGDCLDQNNVTCYVSADTHSASSLGTTQEKVNARCFKSGSTCDYEGSLWASLALTKLGANSNVSSSIPYVLALAEDYARYFPEAFLYLLTSDDDQYSRLIQLRQQSQFWELRNSPYNRYYDTSLGMLALGSSPAGKTELTPTQEYLMGIRTKEGCWNNNRIFDTAFILYAGWERRGAASLSGGGIGAGSTFCEEAGFSCERLSDCKTAGGLVKEGFECQGVGICCSVKVAQPSCEQKQGKLCSLQTQCSGESVETAEGACCLGSCIPIPATNVCEQAPDATCKTSCDSGETQTSARCGTKSGICCARTASTGSSSWGIILLVILILIVLLAIFFRHKLQLWWFSLRGNVKSTPITRPGSPPSAGRVALQRPALRQPFTQRMMRPGTQRPVQAKDREIEETLKKLRDMSK